MSKSTKTAANENYSVIGESVAPQVGPERAMKEGPSNPWNHRFMTALLDKLKANGTSATDTSRDAGGSANAAGSFRDSDHPADGCEHDGRERYDWLAETQLGESPTRPMTFTYPPGSTPLPRYTIRRGIGVGGFGEVYFAVSDVGKEVAIKRIQRNLEVELRGVSHCLNLKHPNLVALFDICRDQKDQSWVVMEYVAGPNLRQVLDASPDGLPKEEVRRWFSGIATGINHLHSAGLVHRDLKPGNVFDDLGIVKVGDYGLSKFISASHRGGHTESVGTFHYMAPEIGRGQYGREIDIYAMGVLLYELLTGQVPFDGESCHEIIVKHLTATPELQTIQEPYRSTIARCLEKDPAKRFSSIPEMMQALGLPGGLTGVAEVPFPNPTTGTESTGDRIGTDCKREHSIDAKLVNEVHAKSPPQPGRQAADHLAAPAVHASPLTDEPFARAIRASFVDLNQWWATLDRSPGAKAFLVLVAVFVLLVNTHWLLPLLSFVAIVYVPYYVVRQMVLHVSQQPTYAQAQRIATAVGAPRRPMTRSQWRSHMRTDLRAKRSIHRVAELSTSWVAATLTAVGMMFGAGVIGLHDGPLDAMAIAPYGWMALVVLLASLGILGLGKLWERDEGEALPRRFVLAGLGAGVGFVAYGLNEFLMIPLDQGLGRGVDATNLPQAFYQKGVPLASAMMAHFALLFGALRWWKPVDPLRRRRLSLWAVACAVVAEWAVHQVLPIPQPAGMMIAGGVAIAIQMSAPWINPRTLRQQVNSNPTAATVSARSMA